MSNVRATSLPVRDPCRTRTLGGDGVGVGVGVGRAVGRTVGRGVGVAVGVGRTVGRALGVAVGAGDADDDGEGQGEGLVGTVALGPEADGDALALEAVGLGLGRQLGVGPVDGVPEADVPGPQAAVRSAAATRIASAGTGSLTETATRSPGRFDRFQRALLHGPSWTAIRHEAPARTA
jgi:hypothetical protein